VARLAGLAIFVAAMPDPGKRLRQPERWELICNSKSAALTTFSFDLETHKERFACTSRPCPLYESFD
jgi:hypothetical protein